MCLKGGPNRFPHHLFRGAPITRLNNIPNGQQYPALSDGSVYDRCQLCKIDQIAHGRTPNLLFGAFREMRGSYRDMDIAETPAPVMVPRELAQALLDQRGGKSPEDPEDEQHHDRSNNFKDELVRDLDSQLFEECTHWASAACSP